MYLQIDLDYVEGDFPSSNLRPGAVAVPSASGFDDGNTDLFNQHFNGFFNGGGNVFNPFNNFGSIGFGGFNNYKPWYKG